jgi:hypothetical protein
MGEEDEERPDAAARQRREEKERQEREQQREEDERQEREQQQQRQRDELRRQQREQERQREASQNHQEREQQQQRQQDDLERQQREQQRQGRPYDKRAMAAEYEELYSDFERRAKVKEKIMYGSVPWPAKGGSAEFVIDFHADSKHLSKAEKRKLVLQWSRRWHPDTWAKYNLAADDKESILLRVQEVSKKINALKD